MYKPRHTIELAKIENFLKEKSILCARSSIKEPIKRSKSLLYKGLEEKPYILYIREDAEPTTIHFKDLALAVSAYNAVNA